MTEMMRSTLSGCHRLARSIRRVPRAAVAAVGTTPQSQPLPRFSQQQHSFATLPHDTMDDHDTDDHGTFNLYNPTPEHAALRDSVRSFCQRHVEPAATASNAAEQFNVKLFHQLADLGVLGLTVDEEYGGIGWPAEHRATAVCVVHEELSYSDPAFCLSYLAHSLLLVNNLHVNASHEQKLKWLPSLIDSDANDNDNPLQIGGMAMSEPHAGTDVLGMRTTGTCLENSGQWQLDGTKMWITNGTLTGTGTGDLFLVYGRTGPGRQDVTQFVVEKNMAGFTLGQQIKGKLGMRASPTAELVLDKVIVPPENVIGAVNGATLCMMRNLEIERLGLAAMAVGIARRCLDEMMAYAHQRTAFGKSLTDFGQVQRMLAESYAQYRAGKAYLYTTAHQLRDLNSYGNGLDADGVKLFCAPMAKQVADHAIQVLGGNGYTAEYTVERLWRDAKLLEIGGGTNESHHKNMVRDWRKLHGTGNGLLD